MAIPAITFTGPVVVRFLPIEIKGLRLGIVPPQRELEVSCRGALGIKLHELAVGGYQGCPPGRQAIDPIECGSIAPQVNNVLVKTGYKELPPNAIFAIKENLPGNRYGRRTARKDQHRRQREKSRQEHRVFFHLHCHPFGETHDRKKAKSVVNRVLTASKSKDHTLWREYAHVFLLKYKYSFIKG